MFQFDSKPIFLLKMWLVCVFLGVITSGWCFPRNLMEKPNFFQIDIMIEKDEQGRNAIVKDKKRWPDGVIPYRIDKKLDSLKEKIEKAMKHIMDNTCIKFVPWDGKEKGYINIFQGSDCYSYWGRTGKKQPVSLAVGCEPIGTILHELMHAIGFEHEHNRSDRDDYLKIYLENIWPDDADQFDKLKPKENRLINKFDYDSIMIYGMKTFSKDKKSNTMEPLKKDVKITNTYDKTALSVSDIERVNTLYECNKKKTG